MGSLLGNVTVIQDGFIVESKAKVINMYIYMGGEKEWAALQEVALNPNLYSNSSIEQ